MSTAHPEDCGYCAAGEAMRHTYQPPDEERGTGEVTLAERLRALLREYDNTVAIPGQAQDIAEADLLYDVRALLDQTQRDWRVNR